jgi:hypothetical protein
VRAPRRIGRFRVLSVALGAASALASRGAGAEEPTPPVPLTPYTPYVDRGNAVPAPFGYIQPGLAATLRPGAPTLWEASVAYGIGLTSHVWLDGAVGTLKLAPGLSFHSFQIGPNLLLVDNSAFELAATTHVTFGAYDGRPVEQIEPGLFWVVRAAHELRLDTGVFVDANPGPIFTLGLKVPVSLAFQLTRHVYAAVNTGLNVGSFADTVGTTAIPVGMTFGWGERLGARPVGVAVVPTILFPELIKPGVADAFRPGYVAVGLSFVLGSRLW